MEKVTIFVDVQNIYYTVRQVHSGQFNYKKFWDRITEGREVVAAFAYAIDRGDPKQKQFQEILRTIGFEVKLKPFIQRRDGSAKGDWDVGITLDMIEWGPKANTVVLASGDGDFDLVVKKLRDVYDVEVDVFGARPLTAVSLIDAASRFHAIEQDLLMTR